MEKSGANWIVAKPPKKKRKRQVPVKQDSKRCNPLNAEQDYKRRSSTVSNIYAICNPMKSVRKVIRKTLPRYNLRSNPVYHSSTPKIKVNSYVQVDLSQEEISALFEELPFQVSPSDDELPEDSACPSILNYRTVPHPRSSTAFSTLGQADVTTREPLDISLDSSSESLVYPSVREAASPTNPPDSPEFDPADLQSFVYRTPQKAGPARIALQVENISDSDELEARRAGEENQQQSTPSQPPVINSPADLVKLVSRRESSDRDNLSDGSLESSISEDEFSNSSEDNLETMDPAFAHHIQDQMASIQAQLQQQQIQQNRTNRAMEQAPIPESAATRRPVPFHGFDSEDVNRWLDKVEYYLNLRRIDIASPTAVAELVLNLAGPAEDFFYSLPADRKGTFAQLRDELRERFSNDNQSWITWQAISTRQQGAFEPLDTYLTDLTNKFRRLNIADADKMRHFVRGLRPELRETVLLRQPKTFREAEEIARLTSAVKTTMATAPEPGVANPIHDLSKFAHTLLAANAGNTTSTSDALRPLMAKIDDLASKLGVTSGQKTIPVAALSDSAPSSVPVKSENPPAWVETLLEKLSQRPQTSNSVVAALNEPSGEHSGAIHKTRSEFQQLKEMIQNLGREMDARIRGLARRQQPPRAEQPRERTRDGRPVCFTCGRVGHLQTSCPERRNTASRTAPQQPQQSYRPNYSPNSNYNQPRDNYRNCSQTNRREQRLAVLDDDLYDEEFVGHLTPSNSEQMYFARRSTPLHRENNVISAIKPSRRQRMVRCPTNLHEKVATQHAVMSPSNRKPQQAKPSATVASEKFPAPNNNQATPEPITDQGSDASNIPVEFKPAFDLFLRAIKQSQPTTATEDKTLSPQIVNIPNAATNKPIDTDVEDCSEEISSEPDQTSVNRETLKVHDCTPNKVMPARDESSTAQSCPSTTTTSSEKVKKRLPYSDASLHSSDLTTSGVIAGEAVQLLVDTGACLSVIDEQFLQKIYGPFSPKMTDGFLPSIKTVNGERVPVLGKITVPIELNGREFVCDFHVMQNLAYDAILGRDFLQQNRALIDLDNNNITFKRSKDAKKTRKHSSTLPVLGTFFSPTSVGRQTSTKADLEPHPKMHSPNGVHVSQNGKKRVSHYSLLLWVCFVLYLLTASPTVMQESNKPAVQTARKSCVFHDAINENAERGNAGVPVHTIDPLNHNEPYKVTRDNLDAPKSCRVPLKNKQTAVDIFNDSEYAVPDGVRIQKETTLRDLAHESLISVAQDLPKDELKIKPSPTLNL